MRCSKGSRRITVDGVEYRWRATGNDGYINVGIWPTNNVGPFILGNFGYHEKWIQRGDGSATNGGDQIVVTNRLIKRIIEHAIANRDYSPRRKAKPLNLQNLEPLIRWDDAVRGSKRESRNIPFPLYGSTGPVVGYLAPPSNPAYISAKSWNEPEQAMQAVVQGYAHTEGAADFADVINRLRATTPPTSSSTPSLS